MKRIEVPVGAEEMTTLLNVAISAIEEQKTSDSEPVDDSETRLFLTQHILNGAIIE